MNESNFVKQLLTQANCRHCGRQPEPDDTSMLAHREGFWLCSVHCPSCDIRSTVGVSVKQVEECEVVTEFAEAEMGESSTPVSLDDVIDVHTFLKDFGGGTFPRCCLSDS